MSYLDNPRMLAVPAVDRQDLPGGDFILSSPQPLGDVARCVGDWLEHWAERTPNAMFMAERGADGQWVRMTYAQVRQQVGVIAQGLLDLGLGPAQPVVCLSDQSMEQALLMLAANHIGRPFTTISTAYSRMTRDHSKLAAILGKLDAGVVYAADGEVYGDALRHAAGAAKVVLGTNAQAVAGARPFASLLARAETPAVMEAFAAITPQTHAKYLLTSGSTGMPKIVVTTHRMLCANQKQIHLAWPFLKEEKPVLVSWLPWSHAFGTSFNFNMVLCNGGSFYFDDGRPVPGLMDKSIRNLREIQPNLFLNIPRGFDALLAAIDADPAVARDCFGRLRAVFFAGAALPHDTWERFNRAVQSAVGERVMFSSSIGSTETAPVGTLVHWLSDNPRCVGLPTAGMSIKFLPNGDKLEMRMKGPQVFDSYLRDPELTAAAFDEDGFYCIGDAGYLIDEAKPELGIAFNGRVAEDFKLTTGTWVSVGTLRVAVVSALAPHVQDVVVTGHERDEIGLLIFPSPEARQLPAEHLSARVRESLRQLREQSGGGSSHRIARAVVLEDPPCIESGEITDKGYINQRAVLTRRAHEVEALYAQVAHARVIVVD
jgi:feruloyl-CoA synthase